MSEKPLNRKVPVNRKVKPPHSSCSSNKLSRRVTVIRESSKKPIKRCNSEPALPAADIKPIDVGGGRTDDHGGVILQRRACADAFWSSPDLVFPSQQKVEGYNRNSKVVMNVTVQGSPGPVRAMVKLGSSVKETMAIVKKQYSSEGRSPQLDQHSISTFELHSSHFSLQCFDTSETIGDIGGRSFYMRKCKGNSFTTSDITLSNSPTPNTNNVFPNFISCNFKKLMRLPNKIWKLLGCVDG
ncbi:uncharacterized protein At4g22758-like [Rutidosis leptorrhynchoides]|uniref:uncharacterized protein At4g22758-like n=1 Tax=Rutidosis leptorrhynchoides TaxID=125765 RepID=UPI003A9957CC